MFHCCTRVEYSKHKFLASIAYVFKTYLFSPTDVLKHLLDGILGSSIDISYISSGVRLVNGEVLWVSVDNTRTAEDHVVDSMLLHHLHCFVDAVRVWSLAELLKMDRICVKNNRSCMYGHDNKRAVS